MEENLQPTDYFNYNHPEIQSILTKIELEGLSEVNKAINLFEFVRDNYRYSIKSIKMLPQSFIASNIVNRETSFCVPKAVLLATLARSQGIPSRLHFVDFINHRLSDGLAELWGTKIMASHCYAELYLNDKWVKATPSLDKATSEKHNFKLVEFDGINDGLLHSVDRDGNPHAEYVKDHGTFNDVPYEKILEILKDTYGQLEKNLINHMFDAKVNTFD